MNKWPEIGDIRECQTPEGEIICRVIRLLGDGIVVFQDVTTGEMYTGMFHHSVPANMPEPTKCSTEESQ